MKELLKQNTGKRIALILIMILMAVTFVNAENVSVVKQKISAQLNIIESSYIQKLSFSERREAIEAMNKIIAILEELEHDVQPQPEPDTISAMDKETFKELKNQMNNYYYNDFDKLDIVRKITKDNYFSFAQVRKVLGYFNTDIYRFKALKQLYPKLINRKKANELRELFTNQAIVTQVDNLIGN